jgi:hypothetical protein
MICTENRGTDNDLSIADDKAKALKSFIEQSMEIITHMNSLNDDFLKVVENRL